MACKFNLEGNTVKNKNIIPKCVLHQIINEHIHTDTHTQRLPHLHKPTHTHHSYKKRQDSLECSLAELEFPMMLVPRLPQHKSNVNNECPKKSEWSKQRYSLYLTSFSEH